MFFITSKYSKSRATATKGSPGDCRYTSNSRIANNSWEAATAETGRNVGNTGTEETSTGVPSSGDKQLTVLYTIM
jgi:hypothetical protein